MSPAEVLGNGVSQLVLVNMIFMYISLALCRCHVTHSMDGGQGFSVWRQSIPSFLETSLVVPTCNTTCECLLQTARITTQQ